MGRTGEKDFKTFYFYKVALAALEKIQLYIFARMADFSSPAARLKVRGKLKEDKNARGEESLPVCFALISNFYTKDSIRFWDIFQATPIKHTPGKYLMINPSLVLTLFVLATDIQLGGKDFK